MIRVCRELTYYKFSKLASGKNDGFPVAMACVSEWRPAVTAPSSRNAQAHDRSHNRHVRMHVRHPAGSQV